MEIVCEIWENLGTGIRKQLTTWEISFKINIKIKNRIDGECCTARDPKDIFNGKSLSMITNFLILMETPT